jgi:hypothetical protein
LPITSRAKSANQVKSESAGSPFSPKIGISSVTVGRIRRLHREGRIDADPS